MRPRTRACGCVASVLSCIPLLAWAVDPGAAGSLVRFRVDALPLEEFAGTVSQIRLQPKVVQNVVTYATVIDVPNPQLKLKPGMRMSLDLGYLFGNATGTQTAARAYWCNNGFAANVTIAILVAFFPVVLNTTTGLDAVDEDLLDLVRYLHASKLQVFVKIRIPMSLPYVLSGLKISATLSVVGAIVGEFVASSQGLGFLIKDSQAMMNTPPMFASLILISAIGLGLFASIAVVERVFMPWNRAAEAGSAR